MSAKITYNDAFTELQQIVSDIENGDINIDALGEKIRRASELITVCKAKLTASEEEVEKLLAKLEEETPSSDAG
ncbi:exodeoxyribonuclease VII small subunit [Sphingobacterium psychroaquaticum]|uniref:exodeoxyribonuclease VII small subunit n=1 Tax=Sphingobacterium psychroaquaticum TaxID=561061 RepID=UPI00106D95C6|nr:exodeoxyribonuclease VII small subunit [Sphingobacterium psychroaquaticum]QBQ42819.1 exodeoxyribonuclease VII small subunit [Sphingobacterium psychroaquaticum]